MPLFGSLYIGASGLQTSQNAMNTTAHNMTNVDTKGYTRQQILLNTRTYQTLSVSASAVSYQQYGMGVYYSQTRQVRDMFLDRTYRKESGRSAFYETNVKVIDEMEDLFGEFQGVEFSESLENLWKTVQDLDRDPCDLTNQNLLVSRCNEFLKRASLVYTGLCDMQDNLNTQIKNSVDTINKYGEELVQINKQIMRAEAGKVEHANDLRDRRNYILDELSKMGKISYEEDMYGAVTVQFEGVDFVKTESYNKMEVYADRETGFYTPYWPQLADYETASWGERIPILESATVYDTTQEIRSSLNTDIGSLRSLLYARGDKRATYQDVAEENIEAYNRDISQSLLMNVQAEFDQLINKVVTAINDVLRQAAESEPDTDYMKARDENGNVLRDEFGNPIAIQMFELISDDPEKGFTIGNMIVNEDLKREPGILSFRLKDGSEDKATTARLKAAFSEETHTLNPNLETKVSLIGYYTNLIDQLSITGEASKEIADLQAEVVNETFSAREMIVGVSDSEEMEFMIKFQNAFNASSRYVNVINEMIEHILSTLGR
ncbi:MAG: flagellar hook-associated protein FlgK [Lachnospiraceae bacterium]|jgi:flagellar hook-associated protein 1 FlgK|nr:flagellar hook-associated protein FlgK [Lachnospiraceae bacterium]